MAKTNLTFAGVTLVDVVSTGGFYKQTTKLPDAVEFRRINFHNAAYKIKRAIGKARTKATSETIIFDCVAEVPSTGAGSKDEKAAEELIAAIVALQQAGTVGALGFSTPVISGAVRSWNSMVLERFHQTTPIQAPASGNWRVVFRVEFERYAAQA